MTHTHAKKSSSKVSRFRSLSGNKRTDGRTDTNDRISLHAHTVGKNRVAFAAKDVTEISSTIYVTVRIVHCMCYFVLDKNIPKLRLLERKDLLSDCTHKDDKLWLKKIKSLFPAIVLY